MRRFLKNTLREITFLKRLVRLVRKYYYSDPKFISLLTTFEKYAPNSSGKPKLKSHDVWLVDILMPRKFVDEFTDEQINMGDSQVDMEALNNAYNKGLDDETNQAQDI